MDAESQTGTGATWRDSHPGNATDCVYTFPVTFAQQRLLFLNQLNPASTSYVVPWSLRIKGPVDAAALERSLNEIVHRHEILRTTYDVVESEAVQIVRPFEPVPLKRINLASLVDPEREAQSAAMREARTPIDLKNGPMVRTTLLELDTHDYVLLITTHHIAFDGWSRRILVSELAALYEAFYSGLPSPLPELALQYADYAVWQREFLQGPHIDRLLDYWKQQLSGAPTTLDLPTDRPRPVVQTFLGATHSFVIPPSLVEAVMNESRKLGVTPFMTLLAGFQLLLYRYSGQDDFLVGGVIANRDRAEIEGLIGYFANTLPVRTRLKGDPSFRELLSRVKETALGAYAHQEMPFERLVEELRPERSLSYNPLFQVLFSLQNAPRRAFELAGLELQPLGGVAGTTAKFDLSCYLLQGAAGLSGRLEYNTDLFDGSTVERMVGHYLRLLEVALEAPDQKISELPILTLDERQRILVEWNATQADYPRESCLHQLFERQAELRPDAIACQFENERISYRSLNERANQLAHALLRKGIGPGRRVGIFVERSLEMMVGLLGIQKSGAAYVPLDPAYPAERLRLILEDAKVPLVLAQASLLGQMPEHDADVLCLDSDEPQISGESTLNPVVNVSTEDLIYVIFTSGSTGRPKGVQVPHRAVVNLMNFMGRELRMGPDDVFPALASYAFDMCIPELYLPLVTGGRVLLGGRHLASNGEELAELLRKNGATVVHATPTTWSLLLDAGFTAKGLKRAIGAEPLPPELCTRLLEADNSLYNFYGPTETTVWSAFHHFRTSSEPVVVGRPLDNTQIYILDRNGQPVPPGVLGEICIGGDGVTCGYLNRPELTAEKYVADPFAGTPSARMYRTGDLGSFLADVRIVFKGRVDNQIKVRGFRVELGEIETVLRRHPTVQDCAVIAREDVAGDKRLVAYIVAAPSAILEFPDLHNWLKDHLPDYMVPVACVEMPQLPLSPNGKVDRKNLPAPEFDRPDTGREYHEPRTPLEEVMAWIWAEVLLLERVGIHDQFFELNGHSLLATQVVSRVRQVFQVELPLRALFEAPTVAGLAERVALLQRKQQGLMLPAMRAIDRTTPPPLSFAQQRIWFLDQLDKGSTHYNVPYVARMKGQLRTDVLEASLNEIVRRHETLRTSFQLIDDQPVQIIVPHLTCPLVIEDLTGLPAQSREAEAKRRSEQELLRPFDLSVAPLFRARLLKLTDDDHVLILSTHHVVSDRWSINLLSQELATLYAAFSANRPSPLLELTIQYADYAVWQREFLAGKTLDRQLSYWRNQLSSAPPSLDLPTDHPRPPMQTFAGSRETVVLPGELLDDLRKLSRREGVTLFMTLAAGFNVLLSRYSGQQDIVIGTPIAGRNRGEVEKLIGLFVNTLVLRTDLSGTPSFQELLGRVREVAMGAYARQDVPFEKLVEELKPIRDLSRHPLFQVMLVLQNVPVSETQIADLRTIPIGIDTHSARFDLSVVAAESAEGLRVSITYNTALFESQTIQRMLGHYQQVLKAAISDPTQTVGRMPLLTDEELHHIVVEWNEGHVELPQGCFVMNLIEQQVQKTPNALAVVCESQQVTYRELNSRANQLAHRLRKMGVEPGIFVGICAERSLELITAVWGVVKAGGAYVPLDPELPESRLATMVDDGHLEVLLTQELLLGRVPGKLKTVCLDRDWPSLADEPTTNLDVSVKGSDPLFVIYTSGSTGIPKGAVNTYLGTLNQMLWRQKEYRLRPDDRILQKTQCSYDVSVWEFFWPFIAGSSLVIARPGGHRDPQYLVNIIRDQKITVVHFIPSMLRIFLEQSRVEQCKSLRLFFSGGEVLTLDLQNKFFKVFGEILENCYGPSETTIDTTWWHCTPDPTYHTVPIGRPVSNTQLYILDPYLQPQPIGVVGELHIGGANLASGYLNRPELTAEKFIPNPFSNEPGSRLYKTGDLTRYLYDGNIEYVGRADLQVKIRGVRIELGEVETVLGLHPSVKSCAAAVREEVPGEKRLVAYVVANHGMTITVADLRNWMRERVPEAMVPLGWVEMTALPQLPNGKLDRRALPAPEFGSEDPNKAILPRNDVEATVLRVWQEVLGLDSIGITQNFFDIGGHSLLAVRLMAEIEKATGKLLPVSTLFEGATVEYLASRLNRLGQPTNEVLVEIQGGNAKPPFFGIAATGTGTLGYIALARHLGKHQPFYRICGASPRPKNRGYNATEYENLAAEYITVMKSVQPRGPYYLGGMCEGARIAFDMARLLEAEGEKIGLLAIFDTWVLENSRNRTLFLADHYTGRLMDFWHRTPRKKWQTLLRWLKHPFRLIKPPKSFKPTFWPGRDFVPAKCAGSIIVFKTPKQPFYYGNDPLLGWGTRTTGVVEAHLVDSTHHHLLRYPCVRQIADKLADSLGQPSSGAGDYTAKQLL